MQTKVRILKIKQGIRLLILSHPDGKRFQTTECSGPSMLPLSLIASLMIFIITEWKNKECTRGFPNEEGQSFPSLS
ncbi:MAG: hypothetical protein HYU69_09225 [Bacteroidetes bacterium]|nr:hypothetical protein [Bacteroidota bacterium]